MMGDVIRFDSQLEFKVFQVLKDSSIVSNIIPHYQLEIVPKKISTVFTTPQLKGPLAAQ